MQKLIITEELPDLNTEINNAKKHWSYYSKVKKQYTYLVAWQAKMQLKPVKEKSIFAFHWYMKNKRKDPDNIAFAKKYVLDGLVNAWIIEKDNWEFVGGLSDTFHLDKKNPRLELFIYEEIHKELPKS